MAMLDVFNRDIKNLQGKIRPVSDLVGQLDEYRR